MQILAELFRAQNLNINGKTVHRSAVRAVIPRGSRLLMIYSTVNGDYKFPGGGVKNNESMEAALRREVMEESGMSLGRILREIGAVVEYGAPMRRKFDVFKMTSSYFQCEIASTGHPLRLDDYEKHLGFQPVWVNIDVAILTNKAVCQDQTKRPPEWTAREVFMLEYLKEHVLNSSKPTASTTTSYSALP